jgi:murein DD-endopeptidase MepM/ murein hydrolase activator NlpD
MRRLLLRCVTATRLARLCLVPLCGAFACLAALCTALLANGCAPAPAVSRQVATDVVLRSEFKLVTGQVPPHATLNAMLRAQGIDAGVVNRVVAAAGQVFDLRRLRSTQPFSLKRTLAGALNAFEYEIDAASLLRVVAEGDGATLKAEVVPIPRTLEYAVASGAITSETPSLFGAMAAAGERPDLAIAIADIFSGEIDFNTELQPDDAFTVSFERFRREGRPDAYGEVTAVEFHNDGRVLRAIRYVPRDGKPGYYDEQGRSVRRFFLRSPLKFEPRITSGFSASRLHPILHTTRAHRGVDYAAPTGAPVVAAASGTVISATYDASNGRMVRIRHASGYESYYLHLSKFAAGIRAGVHVDQGQTIGLVGQSGLATGPHLHYGLKRGGVFVNPLLEHRNMAPGEPLAASEMDAFRAERDRVLAVLRTKGVTGPI